MKITKGKQKTAVRAVIYGVEGIGKTSLAALLPAPLFLDMEEGTHQLDVARASVDSIAALAGSLAELATDAQGFKTIVIDSADWAERLASENLIKNSGKKSIEDFGFGKGFVRLSEEMARLLTACDTLISKGVHVVWIAHAKTIRVSPPDMVDGFDRYELKMAKQTAPLFKEWADLLLFANYELTIIKGNDGRVKGEGGKRRLLFAERDAAWDAKNRYGLPDKMPMEAGKLPAALAAIFAGEVTAKPKPPPVATPAPTPDPTPSGEEDFDESDADALLSWLAAHEPAVNAFLVSKRWMQEGQTFRDLPADKLATIEAKADAFADAAGIPDRFKI